MKLDGRACIIRSHILRCIDGTQLQGPTMADAMTKKKRPVYLNLMQVRLPLPGWVSILHRVSGTLLFLLLLIFGVMWFAESLGSAEGFASAKQTLSLPFFKLVLLAALW